MDKPREIALKTLYEINEKGAYVNIALHRNLEANDLKEIDRGFITELVYGTMKWKLTMDWVIAKHSSIKLKKISPWVLNILRMGVYQLLYMDRIPASAACNESVKLVKKYGHIKTQGFANAVLRSIARDGRDVAYPDKQEALIQYLSVRYSYPIWMVERFLTLFDADFTESFLDSSNQIPELTLRANTLKVSKEKMIESLEKEGILVTAGKYLKEAVIVKEASSITRLEGFQKGWFQVQDESSMLVGKVLDPKPGELVMDVCSAPGGKATHLAQMMADTGTVIARDIHPHKIKLIEDAVKRLGLKSVKVQQWDATRVDSEYEEKADRVLVDAPCSGLGIIRRKPDIKWARTEADLIEVLKLQDSILETSATYVKKGGFLVYSTCTILPEENHHIIEKFLQRHPEFVMEDIQHCLPQTLEDTTKTQGFIQLYPNIHGTDGFFIAKMRRKIEVTES